MFSTIKSIIEIIMFLWDTYNFAKGKMKKHEYEKKHAHRAEARDKFLNAKTKLEKLKALRDIK